ncbi:MAG: AraC family transcriptional regulator [Hyphomicrobiales bacterium]
MQTKYAIKAFEVHIEELSYWKQRPYKNNFFELVYIDEGNGYQCINTNNSKYYKGNIFLLPPMDCHSYEIRSNTKFYFIRFTDYLFINKDEASEHKNWFNKIAYILANYNKAPGDIIESEEERQYIIFTIKMIAAEYQKKDSYSNSLIISGMKSILNILARNIERLYVIEANKKDSKFGSILRYIHTNLNNSEKLRLTHLAEEFAISPTYFSEYFKKHSGLPLVEYILKAKFKLIESKILHTDSSLKEIAIEMNFSDSSHLTKAFKKMYGMTIKEFKEKGSSCAI